MDIYIAPSSEWRMINGRFYCMHVNVIVETITEEFFHNDDIEESTRQRYVCSDCGEFLDGSPEKDLQDAIAEEQLMRLLGK